MMKNDRFEDFLNEKFFAENPQTLDDDWPDAYDEWLVDLEPEQLVKYGQEYADKKLELNLVVKLPFTIHKKD